MSFKTDLTIETDEIAVQNFLTLLQQQRFYILNNKITSYLQLNPDTEFHAELSWMKGHSLLQIKEYMQAKSVLISLISSTNLDIKHRALYDLAIISRYNKDFINEKFYLQQITAAPIDSPLQEVARAKLIMIELSKPKSSTLTSAIQQFETDFPESTYTDKLQYYYALYQFQHSTLSKTKTYVQQLLDKKPSILIQRLMAEIELSEENFDAALTYFVPLTESFNQFQDEALYKSALIFKLQKEFVKSRDLLLKLSRYFKNSAYYERALAELATLNIILKNYDDALTYFLQTSLGANKAPSLLKIAEIYYLKGDTRSTERTVKRLHREFPYSSYANEAIYWLGRSFMVDKKYQKSITQFDEYLIREPQSPKVEEIQIFLGQAYAKLDNQPKARTYFQQIVQHSKDSYLKQKALLGLGHSYSVNEPIRSLEFYDKAWKTPVNTLEAEQALYFAGVIRYNLRYNKEALNNFVEFNKRYKTSTLFPDSTLALAKLRFKEENFNEILSLDTFDSDNKELLAEYKELQARSFFRTRDFEKALPLFQEATSLTTNKIRKTDLFLAEASTLRNLGRHHEAVQQYEKYLKNTDEDNLAELIWSEIITSYIEINKPVQAERTLLQMEQNFPNSPLLAESYFKIADIYFSSERYPIALPLYEQVRLKTKNKDTRIEANFRETWSYYKSNHASAQEKLNEFNILYPRHYAAPSILLALSTLQSNEVELKTTLIQKYPQSPEADTARTFFINQVSTDTDIPTLIKKTQETSDIPLKTKYLYILAQKFELEEDVDNALQVYLDIHKFKDPELGAEAAFKAIKLHQDLKEYQKSLRLGINIISQYDIKHTAKALDSIIQSYVFMEDYENAEKFKDRLISQFPDSPEAKKWN